MNSIGQAQPPKPEQKKHHPQPEVITKDGKRKLIDNVKLVVDNMRDVFNSHSQQIYSCINDNCGIPIPTTMKIHRVLPLYYSVYDLLEPLIERTSICLQDPLILCDAESLRNAYIEGFVKMVVDRFMENRHDLCISANTLHIIRDNLKTKEVFKDLGTQFFGNILEICRHRNPQSTSLFKVVSTDSAKKLIEYVGTQQQQLKEPIQNRGSLNAQEIRSLRDYIGKQIRNHCLATEISRVIKSHSADVKDVANNTRFAYSILQIKDILNHIKLLNEGNLLSLSLSVAQDIFKFCRDNTEHMSERSDLDVVNMLHKCIYEHRVSVMRTPRENSSSLSHSIPIDEGAPEHYKQHKQFMSIYKELMLMEPNDTTKEVLTNLNEQIQAQRSKMEQGEQYMPLSLPEENMRCDVVKELITYLNEIENLYEKNRGLRRLQQKFDDKCRIYKLLSEVKELRNTLIRLDTTQL